MNTGGKNRYVDFFFGEMYWVSMSKDWVFKISTIYWHKFAMEYTYEIISDSKLKQYLYVHIE